MNKLLLILSVFLLPQLSPTAQADADFDIEHFKGKLESVIANAIADQES